MTASRLRRFLVVAATLAVLATPTPGPADDTELFSNVVPPNVMLLVDNSGSMEHVVWHPAFDPSAVPTCNYWDDNRTYFVKPGYGFSGPSDSYIPPQNYTATGAGCTTQPRLVFDDPDISPDPTRWWGRYMNWYFSPAADAYAAEILDLANGSLSACLGGGTFGKYRRSRTTAMRHILREVICQVNAAGQVRFGIAQFREGGDPNGGYVVVPVDDYSPAQDTALDDAIQNIDPDTWTPLGETLFQIYTYFMPRDDKDRPKGKDGKTKFPKYQYRTSLNGPQSNSGPPTVPDSPVQYDCQRHFVIVITDGEPTRDDFDQNGGGTDKGFGDFKDKLIGDYNPDGETETGCSFCSDEGALYLDDIALFMHTQDFDPNRNGFQNFDVYTVGFTTSPNANALLQKTADVGGGLFFTSNDPEALAASIVSAIRDIIEKVQSFTAVSVPASRAASGNTFYATNFRPKKDDAFWEGHLVSFDFAVNGEVTDANGNCVFVNDPVPCDGGDLKPLDVITPIWDAQTKMPAADARNLMVSRVGITPGAKPPLFDTAGIDESDLSLSFAEKPIYTPLGSVATDAGELADEIVQFARGCEFGSSPCVDRAIRLADIFHSNPVVVGPPSAAINDPSYVTFAQTHKNRTKMIYAGSNGGFLHGFVGEVWDTTLVPPAYNRAHATSGEERMGFMPYSVRQTVKGLPVPATAHWYGVDAPPQVADVWLPTTPTDSVKTDDEWHTVLIGGLRQGGRNYYALDVTDPDSPSTFPGYLWEFPCEDPADALCNQWRPYMGETWSEPVITRVKVTVNGSLDSNGKPFERWVAIFTGGYDTKSDPNHTDYDANATEGRAIFMIDIATGRLLAAKHFDPGAPAGDGQRDMTYAIASSVSAYDLDFDGFADVIFVGDLGGQLWKWVVRDVGDHSANESHDLSQPAWTFTKFLDAPEHTVGGKTYYKSFFHAPTAAYVNGKLWLALGTGARADINALGDASTMLENDRFYVVKDTDPFELDAVMTPINGDAPDLDDVTNNALGCAGLTSVNGFFFSLRDGEKAVQKATIFASQVLVPTYVPDNSGDPCVTGGDAFLYAFDLFCGNGYFEPGGGPVDPEAERRVTIGVGMPSAPRVSVGVVPGGGGGGGGPAGFDEFNKVIVVTSDGEMEQIDLDDVLSQMIRLETWRER